MVNTFGILTALVLAFSAFVAYKNKTNIETQNTVIKTEERNKKRNTTDLKNLLADIKILDSDTAVANEKRDKDAAARDEQLEMLAKVQKEAADVEEQTKDAIASAEEKERNVEGLGPIRTLEPILRQLTVSLAEAKDEKQILEAKVSNLRNSRADATEVASKAKQKLKFINSGQSLATLKTSVRTVSRRLGFVTLNGGMNDGVIGGSTVVAMRNGEEVAKLKVTAVSLSTATADVIQSTLKEGMSVSVGDTIVANATAN